MTVEVLTNLRTFTSLMILTCIVKPAEFMQSFYAVFYKLLHTHLDSLSSYSCQDTVQRRVN